MSILLRRHKRLMEQDSSLYKSQRDTLMILWQEIAEQFYPERADFTYQRIVGETFATNLDTSYPVLARRDLGNAFGSMLRPPAKEWFHIRKKNTQHDDSNETERKWLHNAEETQRRAMYDTESGFVRATKEADNDYAAFGQCAISSELATTPATGQILLHRCWHLRDMAWAENEFGAVSQIHRKWNPKARQLTGIFPKTASEHLKKLAKEDPFKEINCRHIIVPAHEYDDEGENKNWNGRPWVSVYLDLDHETVLEEVGIWNKHYVIPRWQTVSGSQYAYSPATVAALPDARLIQSMTYTLLAAGEKAVDPPLIGVAEAIKGGVEAFPGGFTAVDAVYDERLGEVVRPLHMGGEKYVPVGMEMMQDVRHMIAEAFYLNRLNLPDTSSSDMTAFEVSKRIEEFIRNALPLFEPMETDYNGALCEQDFDILLRNGAFGSPQEMPEGLRGQEVEFKFESPLNEAMDRVKGQQLLEAKGVAVEMEPLDPMALRMIDWRTGMRDALHGIGTPADWMVDDGDLDKIQEEEQNKAAMAELAQTVAAGSQVAQQVSQADLMAAQAEEAQAQVPLPEEEAALI